MSSSSSHPPTIGWNIPTCSDDKQPKNKSRKRRDSSSSTSSSSNSSSSSSSSSTCSSDEKQKKKSREERKKEREERRRIRKEKRRLKKAQKCEYKKAKREERKQKKLLKKALKKSKETGGCEIPIELMNTRAKAPETREQYEARQSKIRRVVDPETGRERLIKGDGEVIEECVSRNRHLEINKEATSGDGKFFQMKTLYS